MARAWTWTPEKPAAEKPSVTPKKLLQAQASPAKGAAAVPMEVEPSPEEGLRNLLDSLDAGKAAEIRAALRRAGTSVLEGPTSQATPTSERVTAPVQSVPGEPAKTGPEASGNQGGQAPQGSQNGGEPSENVALQGNQNGGQPCQNVPFQGSQNEGQPAQNVPSQGSQNEGQPAQNVPLEGSQNGGQPLQLATQDSVIASCYIFYIIIQLLLYFKIIYM